jgi:hypothetical protein
MRTLCRLLIPTGVEADADAPISKAMTPMKRPDTCSGLFLCLSHINLAHQPEPLACLAAIRPARWEA